MDASRFDGVPHGAADSTPVHAIPGRHRDHACARRYRHAGQRSDHPLHAHRGGDRHHPRSRVATDANGAVVTGVLVTATNVATNIATTTKTNNDGLYAFTALTPGEYVLAVEQKGFKRFVQSGIVLQIAQATRLDVPLEVGQITEEVSVVGETRVLPEELPMTAARLRPAFEQLAASPPMAQ